MTIRSTALLVVLLAMTSASSADVLYDGSLGTPPTDQSWVYQTNPDPADATQTLISGGIQLDTTLDTADAAGYFRGDQTLSQQGGYALEFDVAINSENHDNLNRAGFSVLLIRDDLKGVELAFWDDFIFQQNSDFTAYAASASHDTTTRQSYTLLIEETSWTLSSGGSDIFSGAMLQYDSASHPIYAQPNVIFLGDDTGSADAVISLYQVALVPEPVSAALLAVGAAVLLRRRSLRA
jgi:hypothetical protein